MAAAAKIVLPPDEYYAGVLLRAALHFFDLTIFQVGVVVLLFAVLAGYGIMLPGAFAAGAGQGISLCRRSSWSSRSSIYWLWFDHSIHASSRYYLRTALVIVTPVFGALAALERHVRRRPARLSVARLDTGDDGAREAGQPRPLAAVFMLLTLVHVVETGKFVTAWRHYRAAVAALATGDDSDPALGDPRFVSSDRIASDLKPLSWFSTTPYLSVTAGELHAEPARDRSGRKLFLAILRHRDGECDKLPARSRKRAAISSASIRACIDRAPRGRASDSNVLEI